MSEIVRHMTKDALLEEVKRLRAYVASLNEMAGELRGVNVAVKRERDAMREQWDDERRSVESISKLVDMIRAERNSATERNGNLCVQLAAMTLERDSMRREVAALVGAVASRRCARVFGCPRTDAAPISKCRECWAAWAKQQAGKDGVR